MPRTARAAVAGVCYHVINRGNARATVFQDEVDYRAFVSLMARACVHAQVSVFAYCVMPNHFHVVLRTDADTGMARWVHWLLTSHAHSHHRRYGTDGRIWQGRFKAFPVQTDHYLLTVLRYVERNALRAGLVARAEHWPWGSLRVRLSRAGSELLRRPPLPLPGDWVDWVNTPQSTVEVEALRRCISRGAPYGSDAWVARTARALGLEHALRPRGRPPKNVVAQTQG